MTSPDSDDEPDPLSPQDRAFEFLSQSDELLKKELFMPDRDWEAYAADIARRAEELENEA